MRTPLTIAAGALALAGCSVDRAPAGLDSSPRPTAAITHAVSECAAPKTGWIFCDDFEQARFGKYFEYDSAKGKFTRRAGVGHDGSYGMRAHFDSGTVSAGSLHLAFGRTPQAFFRPADAGIANYRDVYWRVYVKYQSGWTGGGGYKMSRATIFSSSTTWAQAMIAHVWSGKASGNYLSVDPATGTDALGTVLTTTYNDFAHLRFLGVVRSVTPVFDGAHVGAWQCIEAHARLNDAGYANGVEELWINDVLEARKSGLNWVGRFSAYGINAVFLENYWNAPGSPRRQERFFDRLVVSRQRIGC